MPTNLAPYSYVVRLIRKSACFNLFGKPFFKTKFLNFPKESFKYHAFIKKPFLSQFPYYAFCFIIWSLHNLFCVYIQSSSNKSALRSEMKPHTNLNAYHQPPQHLLWNKPAFKDVLMAYAGAGQATINACSRPLGLQYNTERWVLEQLESCAPYKAAVAAALSPVVGGARIQAYCCQVF